MAPVNANATAKGGSSMGANFTTIRGYVASREERDSPLFWPFAVQHPHNEIPPADEVPADTAKGTDDVPVDHPEEAPRNEVPTEKAPEAVSPNQESEGRKGESVSRTPVENRAVDTVTVHEEISTTKNKCDSPQIGEGGLTFLPGAEMSGTQMRRADVQRAVPHMGYSSPLIVPWDLRPRLQATTGVMRNTVPQVGRGRPGFVPRALSPTVQTTTGEVRNTALQVGHGSTGSVPRRQRSTVQRTTVDVQNRVPHLGRGNPALVPQAARSTARLPRGSIPNTVPLFEVPQAERSTARLPRGNAPNTVPRVEVLQAERSTARLPRGNVYRVPRFEGGISMQLPQPEATSEIFNRSQVTAYRRRQPKEMVKNRQVPTLELSLATPTWFPTEAGAIKKTSANAAKRRVLPQDNIPMLELSLATPMPFSTKSGTGTSSSSAANKRKATEVPLPPQEHEPMLKLSLSARQT